MKFVDVGANLLDERFTAGVYRGTFRHEPDLAWVVDRAISVGVERIVLTAGTVEESRNAVASVRSFRTLHPSIQWSCTVGVHPTRCQQEFVDVVKKDNGDNNDNTERGDQKVLQELLQIATDGMTDQSVVAVGEIGLDYDRLEFCPKQVQQEYLVKQLQVIAQSTGLPLFLHNRSTQSDLYDLLQEHSDCWKASGGVVHSFDDSIELAQQFISMGLYIGINGCSLKTVDNLQTVRDLPLNRIVLETDCPYCEIRSTHAGYEFLETTTTPKFSFPAAKAEKKFEPGFPVKNRQEPCHIVQVAQVVAGAKGVALSELAEACYDNTLRLFGWSSPSPSPQS